jgi:hypothetical protein
LVVTEGGDGSGPNGSVVIIDVATDVRTVALSGLSWASAADMNPDGLVCATTNGMNAKSPELRCSDGRQVALISDASNTVGAGDVLWDGTSGWYVADYANSDLLHVDDSGSLTRTASFDFPYFSETPIALARGSHGRILAALVGRGVVVAVPTSATPPLIDGKSDDVIVGVVSVPDGVLTLTRAKVGDVGALAWCCHGGGALEDELLDGIAGPHGLALLTDGRIAIASDGRVFLFMPHGYGESREAGS